MADRKPAWISKHLTNLSKNNQTEKNNDMKTYAIRYYIVEKIEEDWMFYFWCSTTSGGSDAGAVVLGRSRYTVTLLTAFKIEPWTRIS